MHGQLRQLIAPAFHADVMKKVWGSDYDSMSDRDRASVFKSLRECSREPWVATFLTVPFTNPPESVKRGHCTDFAQRFLK
ncbi:MAG: hypothetical protein IT488_09445 [Gammaproteobacteria bacterium]|nr:hypothetical protein [Gammaproteobacteria bacterium]